MKDFKYLQVEMAQRIIDEAKIHGLLGLLLTRVADLENKLGNYDYSKAYREYRKYTDKTTSRRRSS